jgi:hypothetical protein
VLAFIVRGELIDILVAAPILSLSPVEVIPNVEPDVVPNEICPVVVMLPEPIVMDELFV